MARYRGGTLLHISFVHAGGTVMLGGFYRDATIDTSADMIDSTTAADPWRRRIAGVGDWSGDVMCLDNGTETPMGTADLNTLQPGLAGTLFIGKLGTASGKPKHYGACLIESVGQTMPYNDVVSVKFKIQGDGQWYMNGVY
jgi:hypothetical protein